jgi:lipid A 3-O-deacylase
VNVGGYFEADVGRWTTDNRGVSSSSWVTQVGLTPVLRLRPPGETNRWFMELGVGANFIVPIYQSQDKRFSTQFNLGDHIGMGRQFGACRQHEFALRVQHFSNAGIDRPNPGENFIQLRYSHRL